jgi:hypothetical protein
MRASLPLLFLFACAPSSRQLLAGPLPKSGACPEGPEVTDALGEPVRLGDHDLTTIVVFLSRGAGDEASDLVRRLDEQLLNRPVQMVGIVDLRKYRLVRRLADQRLKKSAAESREHRRERRVAHGVDASDTYVRRWHVIGDFDGKLLERFGVAPEPPRPVAFVISACDHRAGPFQELEATLRAVDHAASKRARSHGVVHKREHAAR